MYIVALRKFLCIAFLLSSYSKLPLFLQILKEWGFSSLLGYILKLLKFSSMILVLVNVSDLQMQYTILNEFADNVHLIG